MKIGIVTDDGKLVSAHFGRATHYLVYDIQDGVVKSKELRQKTNHQSGMELHNMHHQGQAESTFHNTMLSNVADCEALIARGMGRGMYESIIESGMRPFLTEKVYADDAVLAYVNGTLDDHVEKLH